MIRVAQGGLQLFPKIGLQAFNVACIESSSIACWNRTPRAGRPSARRYCDCTSRRNRRSAERTDRLWAREVRTAVESEYVSPLVRSIQLYALLAATAGGATCAAPAPPRDWPVTGGDPGNTRYSPLTQIDRRNVARLRLAWTYHSGDVPPDSQSQIQATPIVVDGVLYTSTPAPARRSRDSGTQARWISAPDSVATFRMPTWSRRVPASSTKTCSSRAPGSARTRAPRRGTSAPTTLEPAAFAGPSTRFPGRENLATTPGQRTPGERPAVRTAGPA